MRYEVVYGLFHLSDSTAIHDIHPLPGKPATTAVAIRLSSPISAVFDAFVAPSRAP